MKLQLSMDAFVTMRAYVNASYSPEEAAKVSPLLSEITGWGTIEQLDSGVFYCDQIFIMDQEASRAEVTMDLEAWASFVAKLAETGDTEAFSKLNLWWHSHPFKGSPVFSTTDTDTMERFHLEEGFLVSLVTNPEGLMSARYDQWSPTRQRLELDVEVLLPALLDADITAVRDEVVEKVKFKTFAPARKFPGSGAYGYQEPVHYGRRWEVMRDGTVFSVNSFDTEVEAAGEADRLTVARGARHTVRDRENQTDRVLADEPLFGARYEVWEKGGEAMLKAFEALDQADDYSDELYALAHIKGENVEYDVLMHCDECGQLVEYLDAMDTCLECQKVFDGWVLEH